MAVSRTVKACGAKPLVVGVIASLADLATAQRLRRPPDAFELRLDRLARAADRLTADVRKLNASLIITARHPAEGGANNLSPSARRDLLRRFLHAAAYVDVELRSLRSCEAVVDTARSATVRVIVSYHDFANTPSVELLLEKAEEAAVAGADIFKVATRTDTPAQLARLLSFYENAPAKIPISAMGIGKLGRAARLTLGRSGSALNYGHLGRARVAGQLSLHDLRKLFATSRNRLPRD
jgi:3-dehydroquinate dehydratase-1